jgi:outer membrane protein assembly factor BamB
MIRVALAASALLLAQNVTAQETPQLDGWWRGTATYAGESKDIYLRFEQRDGKPFVRFSIPWIAADASPLGPYKVDGKQVTLPAAGWTLALNDAGTALSGTIPADIVPVHQFPVVFERSAAPVQIKAEPEGEAPSPVWTAKANGAVFAPLAYDPSTQSVIVGTGRGTIAALKAATGKQRWSAKLGSPIRAAATIANDGLYVATDKGVTKLRKADGRPIWSQAFTGTLVPYKEMSDGASRWDHYSSSVVLSDGLAVVGSRDGCVYALNRQDGAVRQRVCAKDAIVSTPVVNGGRVYFSSFDHKLYAADLRSGEFLWTKDLGAPAPGDLALVDGRIIAGSRTYDLTAHDPATGKVEWTNYFWFSWIDSAPLADLGQLYVGSSDSLRVFAIDGATGRTRWSTFLGGWAWARPAVDTHTVYAGAVGNTNVPYIGPRLGGLAAVARSDGRLKWIFRPPSDPKAIISGFASGPVVARGHMFAADLAGNVYAFKAP